MKKTDSLDTVKKTVITYTKKLLVMILTKKVLAMSAHPDDMEFEAGGTLAKFAKRGYKVHMLVLTNGNYTDMNGKKYLRPELEAESKRAAEILGAEEPIFFDNPVTNLRVTGEIVTQVDNIVDEIKPDIFISHHPFDSHQDHKAAAEIMFAVCRQGRVKNVLSGSTLPYRPNIFAYRPQFFVDITETIETKIDSIRAYRSQYEKFGGEKLIERMIDMAKTQGWAMGYEYAESFEVIRMDESIIGD